MTPQGGRLAEASVLYGAVADALGEKTPAAVWSNRGAALLGLDRVSEAEASWQAALRSDPSHVESHLNLAVSLQGDALASPGRLADAVRHARAALQLRPGYPKAHQALANALQTLGDEAAARAQWDLAEKALAGPGRSGAQSTGDHRASTRSKRPWFVPSAVGPSAEVRVPVPGKTLAVQALSLESKRSPLILSIRDFLAPEECDHIKTAASPKLRASHVVGTGRGGTSRSSSSVWLAMGADPVLVNIRQRAAHLLGVDMPDFLARAEDLQVCTPKLK